MIAWHDRLDGEAGVVEQWFTDARGGVSDGPFAGLNLGAHVGDDPADVERNRALLAATVGVPADRLIWMNQVHGARVVVLDGPWQGEAEPADGVVTSTPGLALTVLVADCTPVLLADPDAGVVAAVHAGRPGMTAGVVTQALAAMRAAGARRPVAAVGPSVCGRCYEVPERMRAQAAAVSPAAHAVSWTGTPAVDVAAGVVEQLRREEVPVTWVPGCTREDEDLYSYRRQQQTGRFAGVVVLRGRA